MAESAEPATPFPLYPGQCYHAMIEGRTFMRVADWPKVPQLKDEFTRVSHSASVPICGRDGKRLEFQVRKMDKNDSQDLLTADDDMWLAVKKVAFRYGATHQDDDKGYDPRLVLDGKEASNIRVRWVVKDLTPPPSTPSTRSIGHEFENVFWDLDKVRDITSSKVSPTNDAEAAAKLSDCYLHTNTPIPGQDATPVWWAVESALVPDLVEAYRGPVEAYRKTLREARAGGLDTGPLRGPAEDDFSTFRAARQKGGEVPQDQRPSLDEHTKKLREDRKRRQM